MNITPLTIYLWQLADKLCLVSQGLAIGISAICVVMAIVALVSRDDTICDNEATQKALLKWAKRLPFAAIFMWILYGAIPTSNTIAMMVVIPKITESKVIQQDLPDIYNAAVQALKDQLQKK